MYTSATALINISSNEENATEDYWIEMLDTISEIV